MVAAIDTWLAVGPPTPHSLFLPWLTEAEDFSPTELLLLLRLGGYLCTPIEPLAFLVAQREARSARAVAAPPAVSEMSCQWAADLAAEGPAELAVVRVPGLLDVERAAVAAALRRVLGGVRGLRWSEVEAAVRGSETPPLLGLQPPRGEPSLRQQIEAARLTHWAAAGSDYTIMTASTDSTQQTAIANAILVAIGALPGRTYDTRSRVLPTSARWLGGGTTPLLNAASATRP
jgi:hypothetical protein